ncbi:transporter substrate-binding domain-containing protein [Ideonella azotifigens]|uniref:Solute-binding protein family 3/N-terminal domain-containing protein n=1 Tax=Ideonella azotifigens TaxID=513160 RepID=A0ABN1JZV1_9BURK|nr:transporter substrate-binding domain-containing protein [Ideonella azotifigens]MCD2342584.1 transporter substrate-binding domain-containing protein [Ideonella azotifigens]
MRRRCLARLVFISLSCLIALPGLAQARSLRIATGELPPYATQSRADQGIALNIVRQALKTAGHEVIYSFMPWGRAQEETKAGLWDGSAYWGRRPDRERDFLLSDNVLTEQWVVLYRAGLKLDWQVPTDLAPYTFAAIRTYTYTPEFIARFNDGTLKVDWTPDDLAGLRKLAAGRVDAMLLERNVACHLIDTQLTPAEGKTIRAHPRLITNQFTTHLMLPRQLPGSVALLADFNRGLAALHASGDYQRLLGDVPCQAGLAQPVMITPVPAALRQAPRRG